MALIEIVDYQPRWPGEFAAIAPRLRAAFGDTALAIHHMGSTSVPGLAAKDVPLVPPEAVDIRHQLLVVGEKEIPDQTVPVTRLGHAKKILVLLRRSHFICQGNRQRLCREVWIQ